MNLNAAPVIHARIKNNDFPSSLLVAPSDFDSSDISWARKHITDSTRFFEMVSNEGRRVVFSNSKVLITGISINIAELYKLCGKEPKYDMVENRRTNYAFIGIAIPKSEISSVFDVPYSLFLAQYEKWMKVLWDEPFRENGMPCTKADYAPIDFPEAADVCDNIRISNSGKPVIVDSGVAPIECIAAKATEFAINSNNFAFCSNIDMKKIVTESNFDMITSPRAASIADGIPGSTLIIYKYVNTTRKPPEIITESHTDKTDQIKEPESTKINVYIPTNNSNDSKADVNTGGHSKRNSKIPFIIAAAAVILVIVLIVIFGINE